jgi:hypothetical protein
MNAPFSKEIFNEIRRLFWVNVSIARVLNRGVAVFTRTYFDDETTKTALICMFPRGPLPKKILIC